MEDFLRFLISPLLSVPSKLEITSHPGSVFLKVDDADTGRVIGKHGHVINNIRVMFKTYCTLHHLPQATLSLTAPFKKDQAAS